MAKNYILKLEEVEFDEANGYLVCAISKHLPDDLPDLTGSTLEVGGEKFLCASATKDTISGLLSQSIFTRDGAMPENDPEEFCSMTSTNFTCQISKYPVSGVPYTLSVYLYTGEDESEPSWAEKVGLPEMNVVHEHKETAKNDIEEIIQAIYAKMDTTEEDALSSEIFDNYPGYSPMDRLVIALATYYKLDVNAVLAAGYPNQLKKIAAMIRGDFGVGGVVAPANPGGDLTV